VAGEITTLLARWNEGDLQAVEELMPLVYPRLRSIAGALYRGPREDTTIQPTVLVHEAYLRLLKQKSLDWSDREHFYAFAAQTMRSILVDHFRNQGTHKRGGGVTHLPLHEDVPWITVDSDQILELDRALDELRAVDPRKVRLVELRYFLGCTAEETAELTSLSKATVDREMQVALAWLFRRLRGETTE
jgi:RNA polymerase sigma factor (TIGR02999 family)